MVNIILGQEAIVELIQADLPEKSNSRAGTNNQRSGKLERRMLNDLKVHDMAKLGEPGASERAAKLMVEKLNQ